MPDSLNRDLENPIEAVYRCYAALAATAPLNPDSGFGGKLLYAGAIQDASRNLLYAANISGAASLAASANPAVLRHAMRDGVIDFLVNSLEEALRILKNEIRKRQTVSVGIGIEPAALVEQMLDHGVLPDLLPAFATEQEAKFLSLGARQLIEPAPDQAAGFVSWTVDKDFPRWLPRLDACAQNALPAEDHLRRRWLALAPRYLGRLAQRRHGVVLSSEELAHFKTGIQQLLSKNKAAAEPAPEVTISG